MFPLGGRIGNGLRICIVMLQTMSRFSNLKGKESRLKNNAALVLTEKRKQTYGRQAEARYERDGREFAIHRCKLLYIEWINSQVQMYSTGNYIQYAMINHNGNEYF